MATEYVRILLWISVLLKTGRTFTTSNSIANTTVPPTTAPSNSTTGAPIATTLAEIATTPEITTGNNIADTTVPPTIAPSNSTTGDPIATTLAEIATTAEITTDINITDTTVPSTIAPSNSTTGDPIATTLAEIATTPKITTDINITDTTVPSTIAPSNSTTGDPIATTLAEIATTPQITTDNNIANTTVPITIAPSNSTTGAPIGTTLAVLSTTPETTADNNIADTTLPATVAPNNSTTAAPIETTLEATSETTTADIVADTTVAATTIESYPTTGDPVATTLDEITTTSEVTTSAARIPETTVEATTTENYPTTAAPVATTLAEITTTSEVTTSAVAIPETTVAAITTESYPTTTGLVAKTLAEITTTSELATTVEAEAETTAAATTESDTTTDVPVTTTLADTTTTTSEVTTSAIDATTDTASSTTETQKETTTDISMEDYTYYDYSEETTDEQSIASELNSSEQTTLETTTEEQTTTLEPTTAEQTTIEDTTVDQTTLEPTTEEETTSVSTTEEQTTSEPTIEKQTTLEHTTEDQTSLEPTTEDVTRTSEFSTVEQTTSELMTQEQTTLEPTIEEHRTFKPTTEEQTTLESATEEQTTLESTTVEQTTLEPTTVEQATFEPTTVEQITLELTTKEETTTSELTTEEQTTLEPTTEEQTTLEPTTEEQTTLDPTTEEQMTLEPTTEEQTTLEPTTEEQTTLEPTTEKQTTLEPTTEEQTTFEPTIDERTTLELTTDEQMTLEPTTEEQTTLEPTTEEQTTLEPTTEEQTTLEPTTEKQTTLEPTTEEQTTLEPTTEEQTTLEPTTEEQTTLEPTTEEQTTLEPTTEEQTTLEPTTEEQTTLEPTTEEQTTLEPTTEEQTTLEPTTEEQMTLEPTTEEQTTLEPTTEEQTTLEPTTEEQTTLEPTKEEQTTFEPTIDKRTTSEFLTTDEQMTLEPTTEEQTTLEPTTEEQTTLEPTTEEQTTLEPTTEERTTLEPTTEEQTTLEPTTEEQTTLEPTTEKQTTLEPTTEKQTTLEPTTEEQTTLEPTTEQTTLEPTTEEQTTWEPSTEEQTTLEPTTEKQTTLEPTTEEQTTLEPTTEEQTTLEPTTEQTTLEPTTEEQTTLEPTTEEQTTLQTTTDVQTKLEPTTVEQTTLELTTEEQTILDTTTEEQTTILETTTEEETTTPVSTTEQNTLKPILEEQTTSRFTTEEQITILEPTTEEQTIPEITTKQSTLDTTAGNPIATCFKTKNFFDAAYKSAALALSTSRDNTIIPNVNLQTTNCKDGIRYTWHVLKNDSTIISTFNTSTITFEKNKWEAGTFTVTLIVLTSIDQEFDEMYVEFELPPFLVGLLGGSQRRLGLKDEIEIKAVDSSNDASSGTSFQFEWKCRKTKMTATEISKVIQDFQSRGTTVDSNGTTCNEMVPNDKNVGVFKFKNGQGDFWYIITVTLNKGSRSGQAIQAVYVEEEEKVPLVSIICHRNCLQKLTAGTRIVLEVSCSNCEEATYKWTAEKYKADTSKYESYNITHILDTAGDTTDTLGIKAHNQLEPGSRLNFVAVVTAFGSSVTTTYAVSVNVPPRDGKCDVSPQEGEASITEFEISCSGWKDEGSREGQDDKVDLSEPLVYSYYQGEEQLLIDVTNEPRVKSVLALGDDEKDYAVKIRVRITDIFYAYTEITLEVKVKNPVVQDRELTADEINDALEKLPVFSESEQPKVVLKQAEAVSSIVKTMNVSDKNDSISLGRPDSWKAGMLDANEFGNETASYDELFNGIMRRPENKAKLTLQEAVRNMSRHMLNALKNPKENDYYFTELGANSFSETLNNEDAVDDEAATNAADALQILTNLYNDKTDKILKDFYGKSDPHVEKTAKSIFSLASNLIDVTVPANLASEYEALSVTDTADARQYVESMAALNKDEAAMLAEQSELTPEERSTKTMKAVTTTSREVVGRLIAGTCRGCNDVYKKPSMEVSLTKNHKSRLENVPLEIEGSSVTSSGISGNGIVRYAATKFKRNPYIYGKSDFGSLISSDVIDITLTDDNNNPVGADTVTVYQPTPNIVPITVYPSYTTGDPSKLFYFNIFYRNTVDDFCLKIEPEDLKLESYDVFIRQGIFPTHLAFDVQSMLSQSTKWKFCIPSKHFRRRGPIYFGLRPHVSSAPRSPDADGVALARGSSPSAKPDPALSPFNLTAMTSACLTWDKTEEKWVKDDCDMEWIPEDNKIKCKCKTRRGMVFGNTFYVPPNTIDFSTAFLKFSPEDQAAVLSVIILVFLLFIVLIMWSRYEDKKDLIKWGITPLADNAVGHCWHYVVTVCTGLRRGAGTKSRVGFIVSGSKGDTGVRELRDTVRKEFGRASVIHFLMSTGTSLGELDYIHIWHDGSGRGRSCDWYLSRIEIEDVQTKQKYIFLCEKWLTVEDEFETPDAVIPVSGSDNTKQFKNMFFLNAKENLSENHIAISIFYRPTTSNFTRAQRSTCFILFLMLTMISNAVYFRPEDDYVNSDYTRIGPLVFSLQSVYVSMISVLITTPTVFFVMMLFRKSKPRKTERCSCQCYLPCMKNCFENLLAESRRLEKILISKAIIQGDGTILPWWCCDLAWILALSGCLVSAFLVLVYSMEWGKQKSEMWLTQFSLTFLETSALLDPLKIVLLAVVLSMITAYCGQLPSAIKSSKDLQLDDIEAHIGYKSELRKPFTKLSEEALKAARIKRKEEKDMLKAVKNCLATFLFLFIIYSLTFSNRDARSFRLHDKIFKAMISPPETNTPKFSSIKTAKEYMEWLNQVALPVLFPQVYYNGGELHWRLRRFYSDLSNFRVGPPRLRQLRVKTDTINYPYYGNLVVINSYKFDDEQTKDFCFGWKTGPCDLESEAYSFSVQAWKYTDSSKIWGVPILGHVSTYGGGGYIAELDVNLDFSKKIVDELNKHRWLDRQTRVVFFEFTLYSAQTNMFTYVMLMAEFLVTGGVHTMYTISPFRTYQHHGSTGQFMLVCEIGYVIFMLLLFIRILRKVFKLKASFFKTGGNVVDFMILIIGTTEIGLYVVRLHLANETMELFKSDPKRFVNFQHIVYLDFVLVVLLGVIGFLATLRVVNLLGYDKKTDAVFLVIKHCGWHLLTFTITAFYIVLGYAFVGFLIFGQHMSEYKDILNVLEALFIVLIGKNNFKSLDEKEPILAPIYFFSYLFILIYLLLTMFLAILGDSISKIQQESYNGEPSPQVLQYVINMIKKLFGMKVETTTTTIKIGDEFDTQMGELFTLLKSISKDIHTYIDDMPEIYQFYLNLLGCYKRRLLQLQHIQFNQRVS